MKIGILTYHRAFNYGAYVQAYALSQQLTKRFPEHHTEIIDFSYRYDILNRNLAPYKALLRFGYKRYLGVKHNYKAFVGALKKLPLGNRIVTNNHEKAIRKICRQYDFVIVGSDAVFNWTGNPIPNIFFFDTDKCPHVTYAASSHLNRYKDASPEEKNYVKEALQKFSLLSTRDAETERFIEYFSGCETLHSCDPTVLLEFDYSTDALVDKMERKGIDFSKPIVFVMLKDSSFGELTKACFGEDYTIVALKNANAYADIFLDDLTPLEWARVFSYGKITITDFFHGSLLSLKNGTPVISIDSSGYNGEYESKAKDLFCNRLSLPEFYMEMSEKEQFFDKCANIMDNDYAPIIKNALEREAKTFDAFCQRLSALLTKEREKHG